MKLYQVLATGPNRMRHRGVVASSAEEAIEKAQRRHRQAGYYVSEHSFKIVSSHTIVCGSVVDHEDAPHALALDDAHLGEIEAALLDRIATLLACVSRTKGIERNTPSFRTQMKRLELAQAALNQVERA